MSNAVKLNTDGTVEIVDVPEQGKLLEWMYGQIGCDMVEHVYPRMLSEPYMLVIDEEGLLKENPIINFIASWYYQTQVHGQPIVGTVLIMKQDAIDGEMHDVGMSEDEANTFSEFCKGVLPMAVFGIREKLGDRIKK